MIKLVLTKNKMNVKPPLSIHPASSFWNKRWDNKADLDSYFSDNFILGITHFDKFHFVEIHKRTSKNQRWFECNYDYCFLTSLPKTWRVVRRLGYVGLDWVEVRWGEVRWGEVRWGEVRWGEVRWGEVRWGEGLSSLSFWQSY